MNTEMEVKGGRTDETEIFIETASLMLLGDFF